MRNSSIALRRSFNLDKRTHLAIGVALFIFAMALGAYVRIPLPITPVPITLQTLVVLLAGALLGKRHGLLAVSSYVALGAFGLPIFQNYTYGLAALFSPTGGYLIGFLYASYLWDGYLRIAISLKLKFLQSLLLAAL